MKKALVSFALLTLPAFSQTAVYPGRVATDADLKVQVNGKQTKLSASLTSGSTSATVASCTGIVANTLATIDREIIPVTTCSGNTMTFASRGFDGTTAAAHSSGAIVSLFVDAWHHNALRVEVEAIEQTMSAGGSISSGSLTLSGNANIGGNLFVAGNITAPLTITGATTGSAILTLTQTFTGASAASGLVVSINSSISPAIIVSQTGTGGGMQATVGAGNAFSGISVNGDSFSGTASGTGRGVVGRNTSGSGGYGVLGSASGSGARGVRGEITSGTYAVEGIATSAGGGVSGQAAGTGTGASGTSPTGIGVYGSTGTGGIAGGWFDAGGSGIALHVSDRSEFLNNADFKSTADFVGDVSHTGAVTIVCPACGVAMSASGVGTAILGFTTSSTAYPLNITGASTTKMALFTNASGTCTLLLAGLSCTSDSSMKDEIRPMSSSLAGVSRLSPVTYRMKTGDGGRLAGLLAQDVREVFPELVNEDENGKLLLNYSGLIPYLIRALQEQQAEINSLRGQR